MKTTLHSKNQDKEETMTLNKAAGPPTRSVMPAATGNISSSSSSAVVKSFAMVDE